MMQTAALFLDAYRELNARRLFWITMIISGVVVAAFMLVDITEKGIQIAVWEVPLPLNTTLMSREVFFKMMFVNLGVKFWLTWAAAILALVSTASMFPDMISGGAIDLVLSKPISRVRLFLTKYLTGLLFVALQVSVFSSAAFFVLGLKGGTWEPVVFLAIPLVVLFFSYLFCVCVLFGLLTRSTIAALLLTILSWFVIFAVHGTESTMLMLKLGAESERDRLALRVENAARQVEQFRQWDQPDDDIIRERAEHLASLRVELAQSELSASRIETWHRAAMAVKTALPKTSETIDLLERQMISLAEMPTPETRNQHGEVVMQETQEKLIQTLRDRSIAWIVGTSLMFEAVVLAIAAMIFHRRDF